MRVSKVTLMMKWYFLYPNKNLCFGIQTFCDFYGCNWFRFWLTHGKQQLWLTIIFVVWVSAAKGIL